MRSTLIYFFIALILVTLGGCLPTIDGGPKEIAIPIATPDPGPPAEIGLTPKQRNIKALGLLGEGKAPEARVELQASLTEQPADRNSLAQNLISQIDGDPVEMLGSKNFKYEIAKGETLSLIAEQYLGDKFKFYVLARYNDLENPSLVAEGDVIKVPGAKPSEPPIAQNPEPAIEETTDSAVAEATDPMVGEVTDPTVGEVTDPMVAEVTDPTITENPTPPIAEITDPTVVDNQTPQEDGLVEITDLLSNADDMADAGNYGGAIDYLEKGLTRFPDENLIKVYLADDYVKHSEALSDQNKYAEARSALQRAAELDPENKDISWRLEEAGKAARADDLYLEGQKYKDRNAVIDAYESYLAALKVWSTHEPAQTELDDIKPQVAGIYYREGRIAYQRQDLKEALGMYDKALNVDPTHEPAKLDRQRTIELLDKMKDINAANGQDGAGQNATSN